MLEREYFDGIRGAVYIPCRAWNAYQQWRDYDGDVAVRDMGFARSLGINAVRVWASFELWRDCPERFEAAFEDFLTAAWERGIRVMPSLFEFCGREPDRANIDDTDQLTADAVRSPGTGIVCDPSKWSGPFAFVDWFMKRYGDDRRLLAVEAANELKSVEDHRFALAVVKRLKTFGGGVPVTFGAQELLDNLAYVDMIDIIQTHENFVLSPDKLEVSLGRAEMVQTLLKKPRWITEWQRIRSGSSTGFFGGEVDKSQVLPEHAPLARLLGRHRLCGFVWSLMLKPAYLAVSRRHGTFSGIFHEDGSVFSLEDARAVAGDESLVLPERHELPEEFDRVAELSRGK